MAQYLWNTFLLVVSVLAIATAFIIWKFQNRWIPYFEDYYYDISDQVESWRHGSEDGRYAFLRDREAGFSSSNFSLDENIESNDRRAGLDDKAKRAIRRIMRRDPEISFDDARALYTTQQFSRNGVGADGRPTDPRAVFFS